MSPDAGALLMNITRRQTRHHHGIPTGRSTSHPFNTPYGQGTTWMIRVKKAFIEGDVRSTSRLLLTIDVFDRREEPWISTVQPNRKFDCLNKQHELDNTGLNPDPRVQSQPAIPNKHMNARS